MDTVFCRGCLTTTPQQSCIPICVHMRPSVIAQVQPMERLCKASFSIIVGQHLSLLRHPCVWDVREYGVATTEEGCFSTFTRLFGSLLTVNSTDFRVKDTAVSPLPSFLPWHFHVKLHEHLIQEPKTEAIYKWTLDSYFFDAAGKGKTIEHEKKAK